MVRSEEGGGSTMGGGAGGSSPNWRVDIIGEAKDTSGTPFPIVWLNDIEVCVCKEACFCFCGTYREQCAYRFIIRFCPAFF